MMLQSILWLYSFAIVVKVIAKLEFCYFKSNWSQRLLQNDGFIDLLNSIKTHSRDLNYKQFAAL
jgi:hypothetical protein